MKPIYAPFEEMKVVAVIAVIILFFLGIIQIPEGQKIYLVGLLGGFGVLIGLAIFLWAIFSPPMGGGDKNSNKNSRRGE